MENRPSQPATAGQPSGAPITTIVRLDESNPTPSCHKYQRQPSGIAINASSDATLEQKHAILLLDPLDQGEALLFVDLALSSPRLFQQSFDDGFLSSAQVVAVDILKDVSPLHVQDLLTEVRRSDASQQLRSRDTEAHPAGKFDPVSQLNKRYWCIDCENPREYTTRSGWIKHCKEHKIEYKCIQYGQQRARATINDGSNPHEDGHSSIGLCGAIRKRKDQMVTHLRNFHDYSVPHAQELAQEYKVTSEDRFWSCSFCITMCPDLPTRLKHMDVEHFERGQGPEEICFSKEIQGLLLQPGVRVAWTQILVSAMTIGPLQPKISWVRGPTTMALLSSLRKGPTATRSADSLALKAYKLSSFAEGSMPIHYSSTGSVEPPPLLRLDHLSAHTLPEGDREPLFTGHETVYPSIQGHDVGHPPEGIMAMESAFAGIVSSVTAMTGYDDPVFYTSEESGETINFD